MNLAPADFGALALPWLASGAAVLLRLGGLVLVLPFSTTGMVNARARGAFVLYATIAIVLGVAGPTRDVPHSALDWLLFLGPEVALGAGIGLLARLVLAAGTAMGQSASMMLGLGFATFVDPGSGAVTDSVGRIVRLVAGLLLVIVDAHLLLFEAVADSFQFLPAGAATWLQVAAASDGIVAEGAKLFEIALRLAAPIFCGVTMVYVVLAVVARVAPQMNLFAFGFVLTIPTGLFLLASSAPQIVTVFSMEWYALPQRILSWLATGVAG